MEEDHNLAGKYSIAPQNTNQKLDGLIARLKTNELPLFKKLGEDLEAERIANIMGTYSDSGNTHTDHVHIAINNASK